MNVYAVIILATLLFSYGLGIISNYLNLKSMDPRLPEEFRDVFDENRYRKSQEYTRARTRFGFVTETIHLAVLLIFWFVGGFNWWDEVIRNWGLNPLLTGLIYMGGLALGNYLISLPFSIWSTFVIEEKFGFNRTNGVTFFMDQLKGLLLAVVIGLPVVAGILYFFMTFEDSAWLISWALAVGFSFLMQYIAPRWIMPLFNKFEPLENGELKTAIMDYAKKVNFSLQNVFVMDGSKRSSKSNAFFTGFGKNKRIALFDTLINQHTVKELVSVLAHEIGHYKKKHILKGMIISIFHTGVIFWLISVFLSHRGLFDAFYMNHPSVYSGFIFFAFLYAPVELILSVFMQIFSRKNEYEADAFAVSTTGNPENMVSALKKLSADNLSNLTPHPFYVFLNYSHPPVLERIRAIREHETGPAS